MIKSTMLSEFIRFVSTMDVLPGGKIDYFNNNIILSLWTGLMVKYIDESYAQ